MTQWAAAVVSIAVPAAFLYAVRKLDLYASGSTGTVLVCVLGGLLAYPVAALANTHSTIAMLSIGVTATAARAALRGAIAPVIEELLKSIPVLAIERRPDFTYFVDGAIFGFASGTAFAMIENIAYMQASGEGMALGNSINRAFSTSLMHGSATALVGVSVGRFRFGHGGTRAVALLGGWFAAIALHSGFNHMVTSGPLDRWRLAGAMAIGLGGVVLTGLAIAWGLHEERLWLRRSLDLDIGATRGEAEIVHRLSDLEKLLAPVERTFGRRRRDAVEEFLRMQARLGLKREAMAMTRNARLREAQGAEIDALSEQVDQLRRAIGVYCMVYVRSILPPETGDLWSGLRLRLAQADDMEDSPAGKSDLWHSLRGRLSS